jgi:hypothetical protein
MVNALRARMVVVSLVLSQEDDKGSSRFEGHVEANNNFFVQWLAG